MDKYFLKRCQSVAVRVLFKKISKRWSTFKKVPSNMGAQTSFYRNVLKNNKIIIVLNGHHVVFSVEYRRNEQAVDIHSLSFFYKAKKILSK